MNESEPSLLVIGAHPDDCDFSSGGTAALWSRAGRKVHFISLTNGDAGHHLAWGSGLASRRRAEAAAAADVLGVVYDIWDTHDGFLEPTLDLRLRLIRTIRLLSPDIIICPRLWDYHPDHRAAARLVQDASYMLMVPAIASDVPSLEQMPVILHCWDHFHEPVPFHADVVVDIAPTIQQKTDALFCHESQVFEWLPHVAGIGASVPQDTLERREMILQALSGRAQNVALSINASDVLLAEAFQLSEYGRQLPVSELATLFALEG